MAENIGQQLATNGEEFEHFLSFFAFFCDFRNFRRVVERGVAAM